MGRFLSRWFEPSVAVLVGLVLVSAGSLWFALDPGPPEPTADEWKAVAKQIERGLELGDALRIHPFWLREGAVVAETVGTERLPLDLSVPLDPMMLYAHRRLWVVSALGRKDAPVPPGATLIEDSEAPGALTVQLYSLPESPILASLTGLLKAATVERFASGRKNKRDCRWNGTGHDCRGRPWENVRVENKEVGGAPRRCFVLHPYPSGGIVAVRFPNVKLGAGILIRAGFTLDAAKNENGSDARMTVRIDGRVAAERTERKNGWDFIPSYIDTADQQGSTADVVLEVTAANEEFRDLCVDGFIVSRPVPEAEAARRCTDPSGNPHPGGC